MSWNTKRKISKPICILSIMRLSSSVHTLSESIKIDGHLHSFPTFIAQRSPFVIHPLAVCRSPDCG